MDMNQELDLIEETEETEEAAMQDLPVFICNTEINVGTQEEVAKAVMGKSALITDIGMYAMCLLIGGYLVADSILNNRWKQNLFMLIIMVGLAILTFVLRKTSPKKALQRWEESLIKKYGSPALHVTTEFYQLSLAQSLKEDEEQIAVDGYSSIDKLVETENYFLLHYQKEQYYILSKKGFTLGGADSFRTFITERIGGK